MQNLTNESYFYGAGESAFQSLDSQDSPTGAMLFVGNADSAKVSLKVERKEKRESKTGTNSLVRSKVVQLGGEIEIVVSEDNRANLELFLFGDSATRAAVTTHTDENKIPATSAVGEIFRLEYQNVSVVAITDDGAADAVVSTSKYEVDRKYGKVKVLADLGTGPFTVKYNADAANVIPVFQHTDRPLYYRHEGINIGNDNDSAFLIEFWKIKLDPVTDLDLITDDYGKFTLKGTLLVSGWKATDPKFGKFGRYVDLGATSDVDLEVDTASPLAGGTETEPYFAIVTGSGGAGGYTWDVSVGTLPTGLSLGQEGNNAVIFGTPEAGTAGAHTFTLRVTDVDSNTATKAYSLTIAS